MSSSEILSACAFQPNSRWLITVLIHSARNFWRNIHQSHRYQRVEQSLVVISLTHLPADLTILVPCHRALYVEDHISITIDQIDRFDGLERELRPHCVVSIGRGPIHSGCVDRLDLAGIVQRRRQSRQDQPDRQFVLVIPQTIGRNVGEFGGSRVIIPPIRAVPDGTITRCRRCYNYGLISWGKSHSANCFSFWVCSNSITPGICSIPKILQILSRWRQLSILINRPVRSTAKKM